MGFLKSYMETVISELLRGSINKETCIRLIADKTDALELRNLELETLEEERKFHLNQGS